MGPPDPLHDDQVRLLRANRRGHLQEPGAQAQGRVHQGRAARRHFLCRIHRRK